MRHYKVKPIRGLARGLQVLNVLQQVRAASLHDLNRATRIPKSTLIRIVLTLHQEGMIWQRMADGAYLPSHSLHERAQLDSASWLVEIASPVLESLCQKVRWPSVLTIPRLDYVEVLETNSHRSYFDDIPLGPVGFRANMLRSASGRAYLAFCPDAEREAVLQRLRKKGQLGHEKAHDAAYIKQIVRSTRLRGYSIRDADFGGHYHKTRAESNDGRNSIAMPIRLNDQVLGCVNLTWKAKLMSVSQLVEKHLSSLKKAVDAIEQRAVEEGIAVASK
jgi:IclR family mhp operon transcriptional activator